MTFVRVQATIAGVSGLPGLSTFYFDNTSTPPTVAEANDVTGRVRAFWVALVASLAAGTTISVHQLIDQIDATTGALLARISAAAAPGVVTSTGTGELPPATALGIRIATAVLINGRLVQGRAFVSPLALAASTNGVPSASAVSQGTTAGGALFTGATAAAPAVWHRPSPGGSNGAIARAAITSVDSSKLWILRSRRD